MAESKIDRPATSNQFWQRNAYMTHVNAVSLRAGYSIQEGRLLFDLVFGDGDIHRLTFNAQKITYEYQHNGEWITNATWNKSS